MYLLDTVKCILNMYLCCGTALSHHHASLTGFDGQPKLPFSSGHYKGGVWVGQGSHQPSPLLRTPCLQHVLILTANAKQSQVPFVGIPICKPEERVTGECITGGQTQSWVLQSMGNQAAKQKEGKLTGTNADLRRLKVPALKEKLRAAGVPEAVLKDVRRWELVDLLREVANIGEGGSEFARNQRMSAAEMMQRKTRLCQEIWQRQVCQSAAPREPVTCPPGWHIWALLLQIMYQCSLCCTCSTQLS